MDHFEVIYKYFHLDNEIHLLKAYKKEVESSFYHKNMYTRVEYTIFGLEPKAFRIETEIINHLTTMELIEKRIRRLELKQKYFTQYLHSIPVNDYDLLHSKYMLCEWAMVDDDLVNELLDEIREIEAAVLLREGYEVEETIKRVILSGDFDENLNVLSELFAI